MESLRKVVDGFVCTVTQIIGEAILNDPKMAKRTIRMNTHTYVLWAVNICT